MTIPTIADIRDQILADIQTGLGLTQPLLPYSAWGVLATAVAGAIVLLYRFGAWVEDQIFPQAADIDALILRGNELGLTRTPSQGWTGTATITGTDGTVIAAGTLWQYDDAVYELTSAVTISGSTTGNFASLETGDSTTLTNGTEIQLVTPQTGVNRVATVASTVLTGEDAESVADYRARIITRQQNPPQGGAIPDWILWATEVAGISEAKVDRPAAGSVTVYPLTDDADPANRIPGSTKLAEVEAYISDPERAPLGAAFIAAVAATELNFDVDISDLSPNTAAVKAAIETAIENHLYSRRPKQYSDEVNPRDVVSAARITKIAIDAGADVATVTLKNAGGLTITDYELEINELAVLRTLTWV